MPLSGGPAPHGVKVAVKERYHAYLPDNINRHAVLTEEKVKLVHDHWNFIADEVGSETRNTARSQISDRLWVAWLSWLLLLLLSSLSCVLSCVGWA